MDTAWPGQSPMPSRPHPVKKISQLNARLNIKIYFDRLPQNSEFLPQKPIRQQAYKNISIILKILLLLWCLTIIFPWPKRYG